MGWFEAYVRDHPDLLANERIRRWEWPAAIAERG
jgi:hypothetical protein